MTSSQDVVPAQGRHRLPSLTGIRAFAALFVFLTHAGYILLFHDGMLGWIYAFALGSLGPMGVSAFFVLSGFVLTWGVRPGTRARDFWRGRFFKIYPIHILVFAVAFGLLLVTGEPIRWVQAIANLLLLQTWIPDSSFAQYAINGITWSLGPELLFYALFPALIVAVTRIRPERLWRWLILSLAGILAIPTLAAFFVPEQPVAPFSLPHVVQSWPQYWFTYYFPVARLLEFVAGMLLARIIRNGRWIGTGYRTAIIAVIAVYVTSIWLPDLYVQAAVWPLAVVLFIGTAAASDLKDQRTILNHRVTVWLGQITYAFYLINLIVLFYPQAALAGQLPRYLAYEPPTWSLTACILYIIGVFIVQVIIAALLFHFVEDPIMRRWGRRQSKPDLPTYPVTEEAVPAAALAMVPDAPASRVADD